MDVILIPGFWLDASSWAPVTEALERAGHRPHPVTPFGAGDPSAAAVTLADQAHDVVRVLDALPGDAVLVGHSGGGAVAHAVVDARPDKVRHVVYVDSGPLADGGVVNDELPVVDGVVPLPDWGAFEDEELAGMTDEIREHFRATALTVPGAVAGAPQRLHDERRYSVPVTIITSTMPEQLLRDLMAKGHPYMAELAKVREVAIRELPTGHWPQLTRPDDLAAMVVDVVGGLDE